MLPEYPDVRFDGPPNVYNDTPYDKRYVAIHNTSNDASDAAEADYAQRRTDASSHYYVDHDSITQSLRTEYGAAHAGSSTGNRHAIAYEITGSNGKSRTWWLANVAWPLLARQIARDCRKHSIDPKVLTVAQMRDGKTTGIVTHDLMRRAWGGTTHTDPGPAFPMDYLIALVRAELDGDDDMTTAAEFLTILEDPRVAAKMRAFAWQYAGGGLPAGASSTLAALTQTHLATVGALPALKSQLDAILAAALDDGDTTVVLPPDAIAALGELRTLIEAVPTADETAEAVADELHERTAP